MAGQNILGIFAIFALTFGTLAILGNPVDVIPEDEISPVADLVAPTDISEPSQPSDEPVIQPELINTADPDVKALDINDVRGTVTEYQAYISYRRGTSSNLAMLLKVLMERENVSVFLDVEDRTGDYDPKLLSLIDASPNFILVLSNGTLEESEGDTKYSDYLHKEIKEAVDAKRRIILVFDNFNFPTPADTKLLSPEIQTALTYQGLTWQHGFVDQSIERLLSYMNEPRFLVSKHKSTLPSRQT